MRQHYAKEWGGRALCGNKLAHATGPEGYNCVKCVARVKKAEEKKAEEKKAEEKKAAKAAKEDE